ncbi:MAG: hypothetical protein WCK89_11385 [bacterium]
MSFAEGVPQETPVKMSFVIPVGQGLFISVEGIARHTGILDKDLFRSGIEFLKIKEKDRLAIREYVEAHKKK